MLGSLDGKLALYRFIHGHPFLFKRRAGVCLNSETLLASCATRWAG